MRPLALPDALLLAWLALEGPTARSHLASLLWPQSTADAARNSLRQRLFKLRRDAGVTLVDGNDTLALAAALQHDLADADTLLADAATPLGYAPELDEWLLQQRRLRQARQRAALSERCGSAEAAQRWPEALALAHELLALEPHSEAAHRAVARVHYLAGDRAAALQAHERCVQMLRREFGAAPSTATRALHAMLRAGEAAVPPSAEPLPAAGEPLPVALLRPPRLVGRAAALQAVAQAQRSGHVALLVASAGAGKTRLLQALCAGDAAPLRLVPAAAALPERMALQARPGLWAVDDLHAADAERITALQALLDDESLAAAGQRWLLAGRPAAPGTPWAALQATLAERARSVTVALPPLDLRAVAELVESLGLPGLDGAEAAALAPALLAQVGGQPLWVLETLRDAWGQGLLPTLSQPGHRQRSQAATLPFAPALLALMAQSLQHLSADAKVLAQVAAVACGGSGERDGEFSVALAAAVLAVPAAQLGPAWAELEAAQVLQGTAFTHALAARAVASGLPSVMAQHLHGRVALWLAGQGAPAATVAAHWQCSDTPAAAIAPLKQAAQDAAAALHPREQCRHLNAAAQLQAAHGDRAGAFDTLHAQLEVQLDVARDAAALALCDALQALADTPAQQLRVQQQRAWLLFNRSERDAALAAGQAYLDAAVAAHDAALVADAHHVLGLVHSLLLGTPVQALAHMRQALAVVGQRGSDRQRAEFHGSMAVVLANNGQLDEARAANLRALEAATACGYVAQQVIVLGNLALTQRAMGRLVDAQAGIQRAIDLHRRHDQLDGANNTLAAGAALVALELGRYDEALRWLDEAETLLARQGAPWLPLMHIRRAAIWLGLGQTARARQALGAPDTVADNQAFVQAMHGLVLARLQVLLGENPDATLARAVALAPTLGRLEVGAALRIEQALRLPVDEGLALLEAVATAARQGGYRASLLAATVRAAQLQAGRDDRAASALADTALALRADCTPVLEHAPALWLSLARTLQTLGRAAEALHLADTEAAVLHRQAAQHVAPEFRSSFFERNPANRDLLALAARLKAAVSPR